MAIDYDYIQLLTETRKDIRKAEDEVDVYFKAVQKYTTAIETIDKLRRETRFYRDDDASTKLSSIILESITAKEEIDNSENKIRTLLTKALSESLSALLYAINHDEDSHNIHLRVRNRILDIKEIVLKLNSYIFDYAPLISILSYVRVQIALMRKDDPDFKYTERRLQSLLNVLMY